MDVTLMAPPTKAAPTEGARPPTGKVGGPAAKAAEAEGGFAHHLFAELSPAKGDAGQGALAWALSPTAEPAATDAEGAPPEGGETLEALLDLDLDLAGAAALQGLALLRPLAAGVAPSVFLGGRLPGAMARAFAFVGAQPVRLEGLADALPAATSPEALAEKLAAAMVAGGKPAGASGEAARTLADTVALSGAIDEAVTPLDEVLTLDGATALDVAGPEAHEGAARIAGAAPQAPAAPVAPTLALQRGETLGSRLPPGVDEQSVLRQISDTLALKRGRQRTEIDLNPAELGRVKVRMELENGVMRVVLRAEHAATHDLLGRSLDQLRRDLMAQGVQIGHLEVRQPGDDQRRGRRDSPRDDEGDFADVMELDEPSSGATRTRRRHDGDVDLEA
ncbi:MAG: flagellar hook-length control protein FliK [Myxococcales bacterium]|nr:flagellar hook-length control protein FliK [Myxococcales bacterium]